MLLRDSIPICRSVRNTEHFTEATIWPEQPGHIRTDHISASLHTDGADH